MRKMQPDVKEMWVSTLKGWPTESRGNTFLRIGDKYDPLGVLCHLHLHAHEGMGWQQGNPTGRGVIFSYLGCRTVPSKEVCEWAGLEHLTTLELVINSLKRGDNKAVYQVICLVDSGWTFEEVAEWIEKNL